MAELELTVLLAFALTFKLCCESIIEVSFEKGEITIRWIEVEDSVVWISSRLFAISWRAHRQLTELLYCPELTKWATQRDGDFWVLRIGRVA